MSEVSRRTWGAADERGFSFTNQGVNTDLICRRLYDMIYVIIVISIVPSNI